MEVSGTPLVKSKSSNTTIHKSRKPRGGNMSSIKVESKESKKRGVYVEKWESPKKFEVEEIRRQREGLEQSRSRPETRSSTSPAATSKFWTSTRALVDQTTGHTKSRKPPYKISSPTTKFPRQTSNTPLPVKNLFKINNTLKKTSHTKTQRHRTEESKTPATKYKFRSSALRHAKVKDSERVITLKSSKRIAQTPSGTSKLARNLSISDHVHWSNIFPSDTQNNTNKNRLQEYIDNRLSGASVSRCALRNSNTYVNDVTMDEVIADSNEKDKQIYKFFKDLLDTVYDDNLENNKIEMVESDVSSNVQMEIEEHVAQKLYRRKPSNQSSKVKERREESKEPRPEVEKPTNRSLKVEDHSFDQSQQLADYYNLRRAFLESKRKSYIPIQRNTTKPSRKTRTKTEVTYFHQDKVSRKKPKKQDLLKLLKEELSKNCNSYEEPENMYQALRALARRKCKRQICFDTPEREPSKSDSDRICRFQRRKVISRSTGLPRKKIAPESFIPTATERYYFESGYSTSDRESNHTLEVFDFDYDDLHDESSGSEYVVKNTKSFTNIFRGIKTQYRIK